MRKDSKGNPLPPKVHEKHGRYYYVHQNKWRALSKEYYRAVAQVAALEAPTEEWRDLVEKTYDHFEWRHVKKKDLAANTIKQYRGVRARIEYGFAEFTPDMVEPADITRFLTLYEKTPNMANRMLSVIKQIFERGVKLGVCRSNPALGVRRLDEAERERYLTDAEYIKIHEKANPTMRVIMDMCYLTGQRISDVLSIKHSDISENGIKFKQQKSKKRQAGTQLTVKMSPELDELIAEAKALHKVDRLSHYLFHPKGKSTRYGYHGIKGAFDRARTKAGITDVTIHDIRAKAATDAEAEGLNPQELLGHRNPGMTERYLRLRRHKTVAGPNIRKLKG